MPFAADGSAGAASEEWVLEAGGTTASIWGLVTVGLFDCFW